MEDIGKLIMNPGFASNIIKSFQRIFNVSQSHYARHICFIVIYQYCMQTPKIFQDPSRIEFSAGLTIWQKRHMPRAPRFWGPRAYSLLFFPHFFCSMFQCETQTVRHQAGPRWFFLFHVSARGPKELKVPRKRMAPKFKNRGPK